MIQKIIGALVRAFERPAEEPAPADNARDFVSRLVDAMRRKGYRVDTGEGEINIVYLAGSTRDGETNSDRPNAFDDLRVVIRFVDGKPEIAGIWEATIETGKALTLRPVNPKGAARIAFGQHTAWQVGYHRGAYEALVQTGGAVPVYRDANKDFKREGDKLDRGWFGINQHHAHDAPLDNIGGHSAGCLVGRTITGHRAFMALVKSDPRYVRDHQYVFTTTVLPALEAQ